MKSSAAAEPRGCAGQPPPTGLQRFCASTSMTLLVVRLNGQVGRRVVDKTGLTGLYDIDLRWTPDQQPNGAPLPAATDVDNTDPSVFTALQEQSGLRLVPETAPIDAFVVESVERPSEN